MSNDRNQIDIPESSTAHLTERKVRTFDRRRFIIASAGGATAGMLAPSTAFAASQNPVINQSGSASIASGQYCTWNTVRGKYSRISITNSSKTNNLIIAVSNAPISGITVQVNGQMAPTLNAIFTLPPNSEIDAMGDFDGNQLTITNITNQLNGANASIQCVTP